MSLVGPHPFVDLQHLWWSCVSDVPWIGGGLGFCPSCAGKDLQDLASVIDVEAAQRLLFRREGHFPDALRELS